MNRGGRERGRRLREQLTTHTYCLERRQDERGEGGGGTRLREKLTPYRQEGNKTEGTANSIQALPGVETR